MSTAEDSFTFDSDLRKRLRADRFKEHLSIDSAVANTESDHVLPSPKRLKGLSTKLEKPYLRLTAAPLPSSVRPLSVLKLALEHVKNQYLNDEKYSYACEQLKSIRQDLTIQNINNRFTAHVYETHARIALECGDLSEYNQCQSRLQELRRKRGILISAGEFDCYRLLHSIHRNNNLEYVSTLSELSQTGELVHIAYLSYISYHVLLSINSVLLG
jgi:hypothetical protein